MNFISAEVELLDTDQTVLNNFTTIQECADVVTAGQTCLVHEGVYYERVNLANVNGTPGNYVTIKGQGMPIIDGNGSLQSLFYKYGVAGHTSWFIIKSLHIKGSLNDGSIFLAGVNDVIIKDNYISDMHGSAECIYLPTYMQENYNILIENNTMWDNAGKECVYIGNHEGAETYDGFDAYNITVRNNYMTNISNECVDIKFDARNNLIENNYMENCGARFESTFGINIHGHDNEIRNNVFAKTGLGRTGGQVIGLSEYSGDLSYNNYVHHNLIYGGDVSNGISVRGKENIIKHNTIINISGWGIDFVCYQNDTPNGGCGNHTIKNNLVMNVGGREITIGGGNKGTSSISDYNLAFDESGGEIFYGFTSAADACTNYGLECNSVDEDSLFVDISDPLGPDGIPWTADDGLRLQEGSPAIDAGEGGSDIGAYEYTSSSNEIWADNCSQEAVQQAIDSADYEDTIIVPGGGCTWNNTLTITKGIKVMGAGIDKTIINIDGPIGYSYGIYFNADPITAQNDYSFSLSGFTFNSISEFYSILYLKNQDITNELTKVTIHDNKFVGRGVTVTHGAMINDLAVFGAVYNNEILDFSHPWRYFGNSHGWTDVEEWVPGSSNAMYYEDNAIYITKDFDTNMIVSGGQGNRFVSRYNTVNLSLRGSTDFSQSYDIHGNQENNPTGGIGIEVYGNNRIGTSGRWLDQRGGQVFFFFNQWDYTNGRGSLNVWEEFDDDFSITVVPCPETSSYPRTALGNCVQHPRDSYYWRNYGQDGSSLSNELNILFDHYNRSAGILNDPLIMFENDGWFRDNNIDFDGTIDSVGSCGYYGGPACTKSGVGCGTLEEMNSTTPAAPGLGFWVTEQDCNDLTGMVGKNPTNPIFGTLYRAEDNGQGEYQWVEYYTPYIYPHPLTVAPFGTTICGEGEITSECWCEGLKTSGSCDHGYYSSSLFHIADTNRNKIIEREELDTYISEWKLNSGISLADVMDAIGKWKAGGYN